MLDVLATVLDWRRSGYRVALATLIDVENSAPRALGATTAVNERGEIAGSLSGGCVEAEVYETARACIGGAPASILTFGAGDDAGAPTLTCGGTVRVFVRALESADDTILTRLLDAVTEARPFALATKLEAPFLGASYAVDANGSLGELGSRNLERAIRNEARAATETPFAVIRTYGPGGEPLLTGASVFLQSFAPKPEMYVFGAVDFSRAMASAGHFLGYRVTVIDARPIFATRARLPDADRIVVAWPDEFLATATVRPSTVLIVLTHDLKFEIPLLRIALESDAGYIGVMGSRSTHGSRIAALRDAGVTSDRLKRLHAPIGLDIGAHSPEETAISICAEIIAARNGRRGGSLRAGSASLHGPVFPREREAVESA